MVLFGASHQALAETPRRVAGSSFVRAPAAELLKRARDLGIAHSRGWLSLLHYRPRGPRAAVSQVDGRRFFLAPDGLRDPEAELAATLVAFAQPVVAGREDEHAQCRFPARRRLLDDQLHFGSALPAPLCPALARFQAELDPVSVSLVYVANFLDDPASAFGHTFIRLKKRRPAGSTISADELDHSVEYTATTDTNNPFLYAFKGLTGLFPGVFRFHSFASKAHEYEDAEARDLWEYHLDLTQSEVQLLMLHLWELADIHFDYYYLTKNCSYHALATIEAAVPRIDLVTHLNLFVLPRDTIKALFSRPGLVRKIDYHPSLRSQLRAQHSRRSSAQPLAPVPTPTDKDPRRAHGSLRATLGSGITSQYQSSFNTLGFRLALHDLTDPPDGEPELAQLQFLDTCLRYDPGQRSFTLDRLTFAEVVALNPLTSYERALSWRARAFGMRLHDAACPDCFAHGLDFSLGATLATESEHLALFVMADTYAAFSPQLDGIGAGFVRAGVGPLAGVRTRLSSHAIALLTASWSYLPGAHLKSTYDVRATLRGELAKDVALGFEGAAQPLSVEGLFASYLYF
jgi:hypothetical protein